MPRPDAPHGAESISFTSSGISPVNCQRTSDDGTSYLIGKMQIEAALATRKMQLGDKFSLKDFMDAYNAAGLVPSSLLRWRLTGEMPEDVKEMLSAP